MSAPSHHLRDIQLLADADVCVKCGLCLPHCPTYLDSQHEGDSPRGRIALVQGLNSGLIGATASMEAHLDGCLSCRRCEVVCPARVPFSRVLDTGRAQLAEIHPARTKTTRVLAATLIPAWVRGLLRGAIEIYRASGLQMLLRATRVLGRGQLARLESLIPSAPRSQREDSVIPGSGDPIALFRGCATDIFERDAIRATETLLGAAGYAVQAINTQTCCGALHQHGGMAEEARRLARQNIAAFSGQQRIASLTTGCAATLRDYAEMEPEGGAALSANVKDFSDWLLPRADRLEFRPLPLRAAIHTPCTALNVMKSDAALRALLSRIPRLELVELDPMQRCCGAAGSHFITHPEAADRLLQPKLDAVARLAPDLIISGNVGCSLHIAAGITRSRQARQQQPAVPPRARAQQRAGLQPALQARQLAPVLPAIPVRHPAQVLADQLVRQRPRS